MAGNGTGGGDILIAAGVGGSGILTLMSGTGTATSGNLTITTADLEGSMGDSGDILVTTGTASTGTTGDIIMSTGTFVQCLILDPSATKFSLYTRLRVEIWDMARNIDD